MPEASTQLRLIAIVPPDPMFSFVRMQQHFIAETWGCRQSLRSPPHITLVPPFSLSPAFTELLINTLIETGANNYSFKLASSGFDAFPPRVVFVKPNLPKELMTLYSHLKDSIGPLIPGTGGNDQDRDFHPHITIAYRDIKPEQFRKIWNYYRNIKIKLSVDVDRFCLLENIQGQWFVNREFMLKSI